MKKLILTTVIILGLTTATFADPQGGGFLKRGGLPEQSMREGEATPMLPNHGSTGNQNADAPIGSGIVLLLGLGAAYLVGKNRKED